MSISRGMWTVLALCGVSVLSILAACLMGPLPLPAADVLAALGLLPGPNTADPMIGTVVLDIRLSRVALSWLTGAALALSGAVFQAILRNPLADPFTLGVSTGAAFGAALAISLGLGGLALLPGLDALPLAGLAGALAALAAVLALSRGQGGSREGLVLAGIVTATFLSALISLLKALDESSLTGIVFWIMGSFQGRGWAHVLLILPSFALAGAIILLHHRQLDILTLGSVQARQLGLEASRVRLRLMVAASLLAGAAVAVAGVVGFVGLVVPHLTRLVLGAEHRWLLPNAALLGGVLLLWSDVLARTLPPGGAELPVGVVTALVGGPFFCLILKRRRGTS